MTQRIENGVTWAQTYNAENRLSGMSNGTETWSFTYDGDGNKVKQINPDGTVSLVLFGGLVTTEETRVSEYFLIAGSVVAYRNPDGLFYMVTDHLGSVIGVPDASGTLLESTRYLPFGGTRGQTCVQGTDLSFTGQRTLPSWITR
jgi:YD repeat-containing protein